MDRNQGETGHLAWCASGVVALAAHLVLLWSTPSTSPENAPPRFALQAETWEAQAAALPTPNALPPRENPSPARGVPQPRAAAARPKRQRLPGTARASEQPAADGDGSARSQRAAGASDAADLPLAQPAAVSSKSAARQAAALQRAPRLLATRDPCAGYFPSAAAVKRGQVQLSLDVDAQGQPHPHQTLLEFPRGQGFENAAKACASKLHFAPALDAQGHPVSARARIALRFERS